MKIRDLKKLMEEVHELTVQINTLSERQKSLLHRIDCINKHLAGSYAKMEHGVRLCAVLDPETEIGTPTYTKE